MGRLEQRCAVGCRVKVQRPRHRVVSSLSRSTSLPRRRPETLLCTCVRALISCCRVTLTRFVAVPYELYDALGSAARARRRWRQDAGQRAEQRQLRAATTKTKTHRLPTMMAGLHRARATGRSSPPDPMPQGRPRRLLLAVGLSLLALPVEEGRSTACCTALTARAGSGEHGCQRAV
jgi:hypothetical protein